MKGTINIPDARLLDVYDAFDYFFNAMSFHHGRLVKEVSLVTGGGYPPHAVCKMPDDTVLTAENRHEAKTVLFKYGYSSKEYYDDNT